MTGKSSIPLLHRRWALLLMAFDISRSTHISMLVQVFGVTIFSGMKGLASC